MGTQSLDTNLKSLLVFGPSESMSFLCFLATGWFYIPIRQQFLPDFCLSIIIFIYVLISLLAVYMNTS